MKKNKKGFTLAELLIVVAIIGVLVAISIPIFSSQLEKAREATDAANIRSQYAQVMAEAITDDGDVDGREMFGAVELKQQKDQWQSTGLGKNLESVYNEVFGEYPKAGGTAWVEYKDEQVILHYEAGNGSGSGNSGSTGGNSGSTGGNTGGGNSGSTGGNSGESGNTGGNSSSTGGNTGGGNSGSAGGNTGSSGGNSSSSGNTGGSSGESSSGSGASTDPAKAYENIKEKSSKWPDEGKTVYVKTGEVVYYDGKLYVSSTTRSWEMSQWWYTTPDKQSGDFYVMNDKPAQTDADLQKPWQGSDKQALVNLSVGDLYQDADNNYYLYRGGSSTNTPPSQNSQDWIRVLTNG